VAEALLAGCDAASVVEVEELPDGRRLVVFADRREVVVGVARPRPHPVAGCEWLSARPPVPERPRVRSAPHRRAETRSRGTRASTHSRQWFTRAAHERAEQLLCSLLDPEQRSDWEQHRGFWVETPRGPVRLGRLFNLIHRPDDEPDQEQVLCVVPDAFHELPIADIWSNLLLVLAVEPDEFFRVAVLRGTRARPW
jgi:hypothetical protein